ncbi:FecR family protein [Aquimarina longa]|uniref:FecR family protein n=1 Tax=Aquimarina longa TaxID=1080221 RepID=UPI000783F91E|nr:FecR family protein [Aquimarina longa]
MATDIDKILAKHFSNQATPDEELQFSVWKRDNLDEFNSLKTIYDGAKLNNYKDLFDVDNGWKEIDAKLTNTKKPKVKKLNLIKIRKWQIAASFLILVTLGYSLIWYFNNPITVQTTQYAKTVHLTDGSIVTLNKNTTLTYPRKFDNDKRTLSLKGEAFFEVKPNPNKPFEVYVNDVLVTVLGTSFNIKSEVNGYAEVVVKTGKVSVELKEKKDQKIILEKGEKGIYKSALLNKEINTDKNFNSWKTGVFIFENEPLTSIISQLENYYKTTILIDSKKSNCFASIILENQTLDQALNELQLLFGFDIKKDNHTIKLSNINCK